LVLVSPGLSRGVAGALAERIRRDGGPSAIAVILDVDPEVCRLGYGEIEAIDLLRPALAARGFELQMQKGIRIGLAMADSEVLIYSPTPMLLEAGSNSEEKPNAIHISNASTPDIAAACGAGEGTESALLQEVGLEVASKSLIDETKADLKENPPRQFDLARLERVFNYKLEYVEFSLSQFRLNTRSISLPAELLGLGDKKLKERIHNTFRVFETGTPFEIEIGQPESPVAEALFSVPPAKVNEKWLSQRADELRKKYFVPLGANSHGNLILKRRKEDFLKEVARLTALVTAYAAKVRESMAEKIAATRNELVESLFPRVKAAPPADWLQRSVDGRLTDDALRQRLEQEIDLAFADVQEHYEPKISCVFKGVNYETITSDKNFREGIEAFFGKEEAIHLLSEYQASRAQEQLQS
jgi:hypothetical protein